MDCRTDITSTLHWLGCSSTSTLWYSKSSNITVKFVISICFHKRLQKVFMDFEIKGVSLSILLDQKNRRQTSSVITVL